jgi:hypothetical protein
MLSCCFSFKKQWLFCFLLSWFSRGGGEDAGSGEREGRSATLRLGSGCGGLDVAAAVTTAAAAVIVAGHPVIVVVPLCMARGQLRLYLKAILQFLPAPLALDTAYHVNECRAQPIYIGLINDLLQERREHVFVEPGVERRALDWRAFDGKTQRNCLTLEVIDYSIEQNLSSGGVIVFMLAVRPVMKKPCFVRVGGLEKKDRKNSMKIG